MAPSVSTPGEGSLEQSALPPVKDGPKVRPGFKPLRFRSLFDAKHKIFSNLLTKTVDMPKLKKKSEKSNKNEQFQCKLSISRVSNLSLVSVNEKNHFHSVITSMPISFILPAKFISLGLK